MGLHSSQVRNTVLMLACLSTALATTLLAGTIRSRAAASEPANCWAHPAQGTHGQTINTSGAPTNLVAGSRSGRVFVSYQYPQFDGYHGHTCVVAIDSATGRLAQVREINQGVPPLGRPSAGMAADNRSGVLLLALEAGLSSTRVVLLSQATLKTLRTKVVPGLIGSAIVVERWDQIYVSTSAGCPKACQWRTYVLSVSRLRVVRTLDS